MKRFFKFFLFLYRKSGLFIGQCRHYPSCSYYAEEAIDRHGWGKGGILALKRIFRCNQLFPGGYDPVP
jgi:putative membrane protein insertion efficiency factor